MAGIYIHIPFCKRKCVYCDFYSTALFDRYAEEYLDAAVREISEQKGFLDSEPVRTVYFGGGTPSLYALVDIGILIGAVRNNFDTSALSEITLEANPEDLSPGYLAALAATGVDRLSIGIQSFDDVMLEFMKRRHSAQRAFDAVRQAREADFSNISIDLIYGIPGMTAAGWEETLRQAVALRPEHISAYHLTFEPGTTLGKWQRAAKVSEVPDEESVRQFLTLHRTLTDAGYEHYEVSNFALPGRRSRHNSSYWDGTPYLGIGPGAHSYDGSLRRWCDMTVQDYVSAPVTEYGSEELTPQERYNELVMTRLRTCEGLRATEVELVCGPGFIGHFLAAAAKFAGQGMLCNDGDRYYIPPENFLTSDAVISTLFI